MTQGTPVKCLPMVDFNSEALCWPGQSLQRIAQIYQAGADGVYLYQYGESAAGSIRAHNALNRWVVSQLGSLASVEALLNKQSLENDSFSRDIYIFFPWPYGNCRVRAWIEGFTPERVEMLYNGTLVSTFEGPDEVLYQLGEDGWEHDYPPTAIPVTVTVRVKEGIYWYSKDYIIDRIY